MLIGIFVNREKRFIAGFFGSYRIFALDGHLLDSGIVSQISLPSKLLI